MSGVKTVISSLRMPFGWPHSRPLCGVSPAIWKSQMEVAEPWSRNAQKRMKIVRADSRIITDARLKMISSESVKIEAKRFAQAKRGKLGQLKDRWACGPRREKTAVPSAAKARTIRPISIQAGQS